MKEIKGILCALVTPLTDREDINREAAVRLCNHVTSGGVDGLIALGSTGEQIALDRQAKIAFVQTLRHAMPVGLPLVAGCGATSTRLAVQNAQDAQKAGADAVIVTPPCFYPFGDRELVRYYTEIAASIDVPVYLYNISRYTKTKISPNIVRRLLDNPRIKGIKESDRDEPYVQELLAIAKQRPDFGVFQGSDRIFLKSFQWGCRGGVTVVGNIAPSLAPALYRAFLSGNMQRADALQSKLLDYVSVLTMLGRFPLEIKVILERLGICGATMTSPFAPVTGEERARLFEAMDRLEQNPD